MVGCTDDPRRPPNASSSATARRPGAAIAATPGAPTSPSPRSARRRPAALAPRLAGWRFADGPGQPPGRARRTAELAGLEAPEPTPDLLEWDYGDYEGRTTPAIRQDRPGWDLFADGVPGGETLHQVATRADRVIARVRAGTGDVVCVAHAHLLRVLAVRWLGVDPASARFLVLGPASVSVLGWEREQPVVEHWNT